MRDRYVLKDWLTAKFIGMIVYYQLYQGLLETKRLGKVSVKDALEVIKSIYKMT